MRIGINLLAILPGYSGGIEAYCRNLVNALAGRDRANEYYLFTNLDNHSDYENVQSNFHAVQVPIHARPQILRILFEQIYLPFLAEKYELNVLQSPTYTWPLLSNVAGVVTIPDMLYKLYPRYVGPFRLLFWSAFVPLSAWRCKRVLTISESSKKDIVKFLGISEEKVVVTPLALDGALGPQPSVSALDLEGVKKKYGLASPYIFSVGSVGKHKNPLVLVRALALVHKHSNPDLELVFAGNDYGSANEILKTADDFQIRQKVRFLGYVPQSELPFLYSGSSVYVSSSFVEGFGLTILEAMMCGAPVISSNRASLPEVVGSAGLLFDPESEAELADAILQITTNEGFREELIARGYDHANKFSWRKMVERVIAVYDEITQKSDSRERNGKKG